MENPGCNKQDLQEGSNTGSKAQAGQSEEEPEAKQNLTAAAKGHTELPRTTGGVSSLTEEGEITKSPTSCCSAGQAGWALCPRALLMPTAEPAPLLWDCSDGLQRGSSHSGEHWSQNKLI